MDTIRTVATFSDNKTLVTGFTTRDFGTLSSRCDTLEKVDHRFRSLSDDFGIEHSRIFTLPQTHSTNVAIIRNREFLNRRDGRRGIRADDPDIRRGNIVIDQSDFDMSWQTGVDGAIVDIDDIFPVTLTADCAPVMFWDSAKRICGIAHVGLVGAINQLPDRMVILMQQEFDIDPAGLEVAILPSIRRCHYNLARSGVWQRLKRAVIALYGDTNPYYVSGFFDLPGFIRWRLELSGVQSSRISDLGICTVCESQNFFSHVHAGLSGAQEKEGRFGSLIGVRRQTKPVHSSNA